MLIVCVLAKADAQYYSVNYDKQTVAAMAAAYGTEAVAEAYYNEQLQNILKHYNAAEVASAGIFASKFLERKAMTELGIWDSSTENYYYRRIYNMVSGKIMPKIWTVAGMMLKSPQTALYWLPMWTARRYSPLTVWRIRKDAVSSVKSLSGEDRQVMCMVWKSRMSAI